MHVNIANDGAIAGVNPAYNVELPVRFEDGRPIRRPITFNDRITAEIERVGKTCSSTRSRSTRWCRRAISPRASSTR
jgi:hypothetical protein